MRRTAAISRLWRRLPDYMKSSPGRRCGAEKPYHVNPLNAHVQKKLDERTPQLLFLGCPGVGKGTYANKLSNRLGIPHIATGDLVREELSQPTPTAQQLKEIVNHGQLVPDDVILNLLSKRLQKVSETGKSGFILDGFPRTLAQAGILDHLAEIDLVLNLKLREDVLIVKCLGRRTCSECGKCFNLANVDIKGTKGSPRILMPPLLPPPGCYSKLRVREDDTEEVVRERIRIHAEESNPVVEYYSGQGKLLDFNVAGGMHETWLRLLAALKLDVDGDAKEMHKETEQNLCALPFSFNSIL